MDLKKAQEMIVMVAENPTASVPTDLLAVAIATVLVRNGLLGAKPEEDA